MERDKIIEELLTFPRDVRAGVVDILLESLNGPVDQSIEEDWLREANSRLEAYLAGETGSREARDAYYTLRKS